jgi:hypothetical protein
MEEAAMHPTIHRDLMQAPVTDLHRDAKRDQLAQAASRARRARRKHGRHSGLSHPATMLMRRALAILAPRSLRHPAQHPGREAAMLSFSRKCLLVLTVVAGLLTIGLAQPAGAVINGTPDGTAHRDVGALVHIDAGMLHAGAPSGVLVSPTVLVVAGHSVAEGKSALEQGHLWVSFAPTVDKTTAGGIRVVRAATLYPAIDIGVMVLAEPAHDAHGPITPATLPPAGLLDQLAAAHHLQSEPLTLVGYGDSALINKQTEDDSSYGTRRDGLQRAQALPPGHPNDLTVSVNVSVPDPVTPGAGDSGGPCFLQGTNTAVGILSDGGDARFFTATRLDTPQVRNFLASFGVSAAAGSRDNPDAVPPILPALRPSELAEVRRAEVQQWQALSYRLPAGARYSNAQMDVFAAEGHARS